MVRRLTTRISCAGSTGSRGASRSTPIVASVKRGAVHGLYAMERAGRLSGQRLFAKHDWFREGARVLVNDQDPALGSWQGAGPVEGHDPLITTSFALQFLAKGRAPVLVHKLRHGPGEDWNNDPADLHNLVVSISREWKHLLTWQVAEPDTPVADLQRAPVLFVNGHKAPVLTEVTKKNLRLYLKRGGFILAEACCGKSEFDAGFRALIKELFPDPKNELHPLAADHAIWNSGQPADPKVHPLWGLDHGGRTAVVYSPTDLSCSWNLAGSRSDHPAVLEALCVGHNIVNYATGGKLPAYKLSTIAPPPEALTGVSGVERDRLRGRALRPRRPPRRVPSLTSGTGRPH